MHVHGVRIDLEHIAAPVGGQGEAVLGCLGFGRLGSGQQRPDPGDVGPQRLAGPVRWSVVPQQGAQPRYRHGMPGLQQQDAQQAALLAARQGQHPAVIGVYLHRPQQPQPHAQHCKPPRPAW